MKKLRNLLILGLFVAVLEAQTYCPRPSQGWMDTIIRNTQDDASYGENIDFSIDVWGDDPGDTIYAWHQDACPWGPHQANGTGEYKFAYYEDFQVPIDAEDFPRMFWSAHVTVTPSIDLWNDCVPWCEPGNEDSYSIDVDYQIEFTFKHVGTGALHAVVASASTYPGTSNPIWHYIYVDDPPPACDWYVDQRGYSGNVHLQVGLMAPPKPTTPGCYVLSSLRVYVDNIQYFSHFDYGISGDVWMEVQGAATDVTVWCFKP